MLDIPPLDPPEGDTPAVLTPVLQANAPDRVPARSLDDESIQLIHTPSSLVPPTSARSLRGQTSRSSMKSKETTPAVQGSSANPILPPSNLQALLRVGMVPGASNETAQQFRARHNENEGHLAAFAANLELTAATHDREHSQRMRELTLLIQEVRAACEQRSHAPAAEPSLSPSALIENPAFKELHAAVVEDRHRITALSRTVDSVRREVNERAEDTHALPLIPPLPTTFAPPQKRFLEEPFVPPSKRSNPGLHQSNDVLFGPVDPNGDARAIANAAVDLIDELDRSDIYTAKYAAGRPGVISIRFRNSEAAEVFLMAVGAAPSLDGQTAIRAGENTPTRRSATPGVISRQSTPLSPHDIITGVKKGLRRR
jgi:hypothetical protein